MSFLESKVARLFLSLYRAATLRGAVEKAAQSVHADLLPGLEAWTAVPIDVDEVAKTRRMVVGPVLSSETCAEGRLQPTRDGFVFSVRADSHEHRRRFSIAHEIGHTLFYEHGEGGPRHRLGLLSKAELKAEEYICNLFAGALLVPAVVLQRLVPDAPVWTATNLMRFAERLRSTFRVSRSVLMNRVADVFSGHPPRVVIEFRYIENTRTKQDPKLRAVGSTGLGPARGRYWVWANRTPAGMNLDSVNRMFTLWDQLSASEREPGWYTLSADGLVPLVNRDVPEHAEFVELGESRAGKWSTVRVSARVATCLLSPPSGSERDVSVLAVLDLQAGNTTAEKADGAENTYAGGA